MKECFILFAEAFYGERKQVADCAYMIGHKKQVSHAETRGELHPALKLPASGLDLMAKVLRDPPKITTSSSPVK